MKHAAEPPAPPSSPAVPAAPVPIDEQAIRTEAARAEQARILEIRSMCEKFGCGDQADALIRDNKTFEEARLQVLEHVALKRPGGAGYQPPIEMGRDERDKFRSAGVDSILLRGGTIIATPAAGADDLRGYSLRELAREALRIAGQPIGGDIREMVGRALTTSDLPNILAAAANKSLFEGYEQADETWQVWCSTGSVPDFKPATINRASETDDLDQIPESGEYKYGGVSDAKETYQLVTYGKLLAITRQAIINDDLNALTDVPRKHGEAAARKVGDLPYAVLIANAAMGDGLALFVGGHANLGTAGAVSTTTIAEAIKLAKQQKDIGGQRRLNIRLEYFIGPVAIEGVAEQYFNSGQVGGATATDAGRALLINPYAGSRFTRAYDARLDDASATTYYFAGRKGRTVTVFFLNGVQSPYMETRDGWSVDGIEYKVRIDAVAKAVDWKAMVKNAGA